MFAFSAGWYYKEAMQAIRQRLHAETRITFRIQEDKAREYKEYCDRQNWVFSDMIRVALDEFTAKYNPKARQTKFEFVK